VLTAGAAWRSNSGGQRWLVVGCAVSLIVGVVAWRGADTLFGWYGNTATWQWRIQLWKDTLPVAQEFWVTGSGLNTYGRLMVVMPHTDLTTDPVQAHNDYLQLAVEGGLLVGVPALLLLFAVARQVARGLRASQDALGWWVRMGAVAGLCGMAVQELSEFSLQVPGVSLLCGVAVALAIHAPASAGARQQRVRPRSRWIRAAAA
jgi:O-antigen ligase